MMFMWLHGAFSHWKAIVRQNEILSDDIVVVHMAVDTAMLDVLLDKAYSMHEAGRCRHVHVLSSEDIETRMAYGHGGICKLVHVDIETIYDIARLYSMYPFYERLYFDSYIVASDYDLMALRGVNGISDEEIAFIAVYDMPEMLEPVGLKPGFIAHEASFVDWEGLAVRDGLGGCRNHADIVDRLEADTIKPDDDIVVFAATVTAGDILKKLQGYNVRAVIDNNQALVGQEMNGISIHAADYLKELPNDVKIIVASRRYRQICEQLYAMGYRVGEQVFVAHASVLNEISIRDIEEMLDEKIRKGEKLYARLRELHGDIPIYINPHTGTGDVYFSWLYLKDKNFMLVIPTESCRRLAELLGMKGIVMDEDDISALVAYGRTVGLEDSGMKVLNYSFDQYVTGRIRGYKCLDYNTMLQRTVFSVDRRAMARRIPQMKSDAIFGANGLCIGRTVLLSPYAGHAIEIPWKFWTGVARWLRDAGYDVCTNVNGDEEAIEGTTGLHVEYAEVLDFVDRAGLFIGLRSGLCDLLATTMAKMVVIYPDQMFSKVVDYYNYFSLEKMGMRTEHLLELTWQGNDIDHYIGEVVAYI